jgi:hypothetical protein
MQKLKWNPEDERQLQELERRRKLFNQAHLPNLVKALRTAVGNSVSEHALSSMAFNMTKHADSIRDALEPYDTGVRARDE